MATQFLAGRAVAGYESTLDRAAGRVLIATATRVADYAELTRPRLCAMALLTVAVGAALASAGSPNWRVLAHALFGMALVAAGASALNQWLERDTDGRMHRTRHRPLPAGRLQSAEVFVFGLGSAALGILYLVMTLANPLAGVVAALTLVSYVCVYTPLKRRTPLNTLVGAVPGALPPLIGWTAVRGSVDAGAVTLFAVLFLWQIPHFLAIAWIHRVDYTRAGLRMLPSIDGNGAMSGRLMVGYCLALIGASLVPVAAGEAGPVYLVIALLLGSAFLTSTVGFLMRRSVARARLVLRASLLYLPALLVLWWLSVVPPMASSSVARGDRGASEKRLQ
jgi:protoheme IX farnesyltransferase